MGPAQTEFKTFMEQCVHLVNLYWPGWNNYGNPSCYIIPPVFNYLHPDVSDEAIQIVQTEALRRPEDAVYSTMDRLLTDRRSNIAEHIVFAACQQLIKDKVRAPFVVVHNLNINQNQKLILQLFPILGEEPFREEFKKCNREYDFLIIGPTVGVIAIEVKSSQYTAGRDFSETNKSLPKRYYEGIQQLDSVDALFKILSVCAEIDCPNVLPIRKLIFTPNMDKNRYDTWKNSMDREARRKVELVTNGVIQWFAEDMENCAEHFNKPPLYTMLHIVLETGVGLSKEISEKVAVLLFGFRSIVSLGGTKYKLDEVHFSHNKAILVEHRRVVQQNPFEGQKNQKESMYSLLKRITLRNRTILPDEPKLFFLSPDQQTVLEGPARQFIIGVAGTGKTIILMAKALELIRKGEEVVVFSPNGYVHEYENFFARYGFKNQRHYRCFKWPHVGFLKLHEYFQTYVEKDRNETCTIDVILRVVCQLVKEEATSKSLNWLVGKNIIIDDTCDAQPFTRVTRSVNEITNLFVAWSLMTFVGNACPAKITWTALDPTIMDKLHMGKCVLTAYIFRKTMEGFLLSDDFVREGAELYRTTILKQVMRCSQSAYRSAYDEKHMLPSGAEPILAHKIQGLKTESDNEFLASTTFEYAMKRLWAMLQETLIGLSRGKVDMANVVVILGYGLDATGRRYSVTIAN